MKTMKFMMSQKHKTRRIPGAVVITFICILTTLLLLPFNSMATTYYVDQKNASASDSNPGTISLPWLTPYAINNHTFSPGDTVYIKAGHYLIDGNSGVWYCAVIHPNQSGTSGNPITISGYPGDTAILDGQYIYGSPGTQNTQPLIGTCGGTNYIVISGLTVINAYARGVEVEGGSLSNRVTGNVIKNMIIHDVWSPNVNDNVEGIWVEFASYTTIQNNLIYHVGNTGGSHSSGVTIYGTDNTIIQNNEMYNIMLAGIQDKSDGSYNTFRFNFIHDTPDGVGIVVVGTHDIQVYGNIMNVSYIGVEPWPEPGPLTNINVYNNVIMGYSIGGFKIDNIVNAVFYNNIFYRTSTPGGLNGDIFTYDCPPNSISLDDYNFYPSNSYFQVFIGLYACNTAYNTLASWQAAYGKDAHSLQGDPLFVGPLTSASGFKLQNGSPAKGAGRIGGVGSGAVVDLGAYPTGTEVIGLSSSLTTAVPPAPPTNISVK